jgi:hypothetical protein
MTPKRPPGYFPDTIQKNILRERDRRLIEKLAADKGRALTYCGMCGEEALDVLKWRDHLNRVEVIERPLPDPASRLQFKTSILSKLTPHFNGHIRLHIVDAWQYLSSEEFAIDYPVDLINLDFCGGMSYESEMEYPKQRLAFTNLFNMAARSRSSFLLLITLMPRDKGKDSYKQYLSSIYASLVESTSRQSRQALLAQADASRKFHESSNLTLFKACIPILLDDIAHAHNFNVKIIYIRLYTTMIHLAFQCSFVQGVLGLPPRHPSSLIHILNQPMRKLLETGVEEARHPPQLMLI